MIKTNYWWSTHSISVISKADLWAIYIIYPKLCWLNYNQEITHILTCLNVYSMPFTFYCMDNLVICIFLFRDHKSSSKSHKSSHSHGSSSKDHHKDRHGDKRKHGSSSSSSKHHHKSAKKSRRWILESYEARINLFLTMPPKSYIPM